MKKLFLVVTTMMITTLGFSQSFYGGDGNGPVCPDGQCPVIVHEFDGINLHKPRTSCASGFGLCIKHPSTRVDCRPCNSGRLIATYENGIANCWGVIINSKYELHLPIALKSEAGFLNTDMTTFTVDDDTFFDGSKKLFSLVGGTYNVLQTTNELIVNIDIL